MFLYPSLRLSFYVTFPLWRRPPNNLPSWRIRARIKFAIPWHALLHSTPHSQREAGDNGLYSHYIDNEPGSSDHFVIINVGWRPNFCCLLFVRPASFVIATEAFDLIRLLIEYTDNLHVQSRMSNLNELLYIWVQFGMQNDSLSWKMSSFVIGNTT